tara:strand:- start:1539 stop:2195 length:657 start_codon:yes stop_codon:yes gene_type:complete
MLLALSGKMRSGKDTAADVLVNKHNFTKVSFADPLKEICAAAFGIDIDHFYNDEFKDTNFKEPLVISGEDIVEMLIQIEERGVDISYDTSSKVIEALEGMTFLSPRTLMQHIGTEIGRKIIKDSIWVDINKTVLGKMEGNVIVADCRYADEVESIREQGGKVGIVIRPGLLLRSSADLHSSETSITDTDEFDIVLINDGTLGSFQEQIELWYSLRKVV